MDPNCRTHYAGPLAKSKLAKNLMLHHKLLTNVYRAGCKYDAINFDTVGLPHFTVIATFSKQINNILLCITSAYDFIFENSQDNMILYGWFCYDTVTGCPKLHHNLYLGREWEWVNQSSHYPSVIEKVHMFSMALKADILNWAISSGILTRLQFFNPDLYQTPEYLKY